MKKSQKILIGMVVVFTMAVTSVSIFASPEYHGSRIGNSSQNTAGISNAMVTPRPTATVSTKTPASTTATVTPPRITCDGTGRYCDGTGYCDLHGKYNCQSCVNSGKTQHHNENKQHTGTGQHKGNAQHSGHNNHR